MATDLNELFTSAFAERLARRAEDADLAMGRQRNGAEQDTRVIGGLIADELLTSNDRTRFADTNASVRIPTTLNQPGAGA